MSRRAPLIVLGAVVLAIGGLTALTGAALAAFFGSGDTLSTGPRHATPDGNGGRSGTGGPELLGGACGGTLRHRPALLADPGRRLSRRAHER
jgi:hypothetical protein